MSTIASLKETKIRSIENISSSSMYRLEWNQLLSSLSNNLEILRQSAFNGDLKVSKFRSICWSLLLRVLNSNVNSWRDQRTQQRERYEKLKGEFVKNPHKLADTNDDPLSQSKQSIWNQYFGDQELCAIIKQDVIRTFPGVDFFRKPIIQEAMTNILFYYAREHPYMCYRQGMHEILAPILFAMHSDHQALLHFKEIADEDEDKILFDVLNPKYLEADSYTLFSRLMSSIESYYRIANMIPTPSGYFPAQTEVISPEENTTATEVEVIGQLNFIRDKILAKEDLHLHNHFLKLDIPLHIFGIRWLRLLFGREFPLQDLLQIWDAIFADSDRFELPNYILVAMLIRIRDKLLLSDYTTCLTLLMKYPNNVDIMLILRHALHMQMPKTFTRPNGAFVYVNARPEKNDQNKVNKHQSLTITRQQSLKLVENSSKQSHSSIKDKYNQRSRSSSLTANLYASDTIIKTTNALNSNFPLQSDIQSSDLKVVDGYRENSVEALNAELQIAQNIMTLSRQKLKKYLHTIRQHIPSDSDDLNQALTGIEELCSFLDVKLIESNDLILPQPVDSASEAAEGAQEVKQLTSNFQRQISLPVSKETSNPHNLSNKHLEINVNKRKSSMNEKTEPSLLNLRTRYEIPDNSFMRNLGTKKDFELKLLKSEHVQDEVLGGVPIPDPLGIRDS